MHGWCYSIVEPLKFWEWWQFSSRIRSTFLCRFQEERREVPAHSGEISCTIERRQKKKGQSVEKRRGRERTVSYKVNDRMKGLQISKREEQKDGTIFGDWRGWIDKDVGIDQKGLLGACGLVVHPGGAGHMWQIYYRKKWFKDLTALGIDDQIARKLSPHLFQRLFWQRLSRRLFPVLLERTLQLALGNRGGHVSRRIAVLLAFSRADKGFEKCTYKSSRQSHEKRERERKLLFAGKEEGLTILRLDSTNTRRGMPRARKSSDDMSSREPQVVNKFCERMVFQDFEFDDGMVFSSSAAISSKSPSSGSSCFHFLTEQ